MESLAGTALAAIKREHGLQDIHGIARGLAIEFVGCLNLVPTRIVVGTIVYVLILGIAIGNVAAIQ